LNVTRRLIDPAAPEGVDVAASPANEDDPDVVEVIE
jgi:hypothetical protein